MKKQNASKSQTATVSARPVFIDVYEWADVKFRVVYCSRTARNALMDRMAASTAPFGKRLHKFPIEVVREVFPDHARLIDGWERNARRDGAILALGMWAL